MYLYNKIKILLITIVMFLLAGCGGGVSSLVDDYSGEIIDTQTYDGTIQQGKIIDISTGEPLSNVEVSIGDITTTTDQQGVYELSGLISSDNKIITFKHNDCYLNSKIIDIQKYSEGTTFSPNYIEVALDKYDDVQNSDSQLQKLWNVNFGLNIEGDSYIDINGDSYSGDVIAKVAYEDVSTEKGLEIFPGAFEGIDTNGILVPFQSYGFFVIDLENNVGNKLDISKDATLTFYNVNSTTLDTIPLWYYDYEQGMWVEEGFATRLADGNYEGTISHAGTWSLSAPIESSPGIYTGRIVYPDGTPVPNLRVYAIGDNWIRSDLSTDDNGMFEIEVIPNQDFGLKAYHTINKYEASYTGTLAAIASGEVVKERS